MMIGKRKRERKERVKRKDQRRRMMMMINLSRIIENKEKRNEEKTPKKTPTFDLLQPFLSA